MLWSELPLKLHGTMIKIQIDVLTLMVTLVPMQPVQNLSHGIYKLAKIFHYLSGLIQLKAAGHGLTGIKQDGLPIANPPLI
jgi:hypothetical protein